MNVVTRFAPSPTGFLHSGGYRTAIFSYLFAKHEGGTFILRIEDTDKERNKPEYEANILESLEWLHLPYDEKFRQSEHAPRHRELLEKLIAEGKAYISRETPQKEGDRAEVIRFKNPGGIVSFQDVIRGEVSMDVADLKDFVIAKSLDEPIFHFAVVVDDADEGVTHVIRGEEHISNTPRQILMQRALGFPTPLYAHLPLILSADRTKLSKRKGAKPVTDYRDQGLLPEAMLNYLALLGWNPGTPQEYFSAEELISAFDLARVQKAGAVFDEVKLLSVNQYWMRKCSDADFMVHLNIPDLPHEQLVKAVPLLKERARTFVEAQEMLTGELACLFHIPTPRKEVLIAKEPSDAQGITSVHLKAVSTLLEELGHASSADEIKKVLMPYADEQGRAAVLWPLRYGLSGEERSPDPFTLIAVLGIEESLTRLTTALAILEK